MKNKFLETAFH